MAIIGIFTLAADGKISGNLKTLTLNTKLQFVPETNKSKDSAPDFRIFVGNGGRCGVEEDRTGQRPGILVRQAG